VIRTWLQSILHLLSDQNLNMRISMRWFTRLTNAFSKKFENHCHALALYFGIIDINARQHFGDCRRRVRSPMHLISVPGITLSLPQDDGSSCSCHHALVLPMRRSTPLACSTAGRHNPTAWYSRHPLLGNDRALPRKSPEISTAIRGVIPLDNLDMPCHRHKTFIRHPDGDIVERAAASREQFRHRNCRATG
jgi:hypothetical protein